MSRLNDQLLDESPEDPAEIARMHRQTRICVCIILIGLASLFLVTKASSKDHPDLPK